MMMSQESIYGMGEWITAIGLFTTIVGLVTMIYSYEPQEKILFYDV